MVVEFTQNGIIRRIKTPRRLKESYVEIKNRKKDIHITVKKISPKEAKRLKLKKWGEYLLQDKIDFISYKLKKQKLKSKKVNRIIRLKKDKGSKVLIQKELFENIIIH